MMVAGTVCYFDIYNFKNELSEFLRTNPTFYVTAMCPVCNSYYSGFTCGIYVTFKGD